jgi:UTP--glucose-1-phosphate uridylyltransferase
MHTRSAVKNAVFPVAGRGTRFLPATKASPKEMLPIVDKPLIQYAVDEALSAGAETLVFVTGSSKRAIEDHFDFNAELESMLQAQGKQELLDALHGILPAWASCIYIRQPAPLGLGHAVLCARPVVGNAPFMVHLADDLIDAEVPCLKQMAAVFAEYGGSVLGVQSVPHEDTEKYGIVSIEGAVAPRVGKMSHIVEKPTPDKAPSDLAVVGRYLLTPAVFDDLQKIGRGAGGEIQLTDGIAQLMLREPVYAYEFEGKRYDCGSKLGYLQATVEYGLKHPSLGSSFAAYLKELIGTRADS